MNYFGIDVHSTYHRVALETSHGEVLEYDIDHTAEGHAILVDLLKQHQPCIIGMEACSGAYKLHDILEPHAVLVRLFDPVTFRRHFPKRGRKTDQVDALNLIRACRVEIESIWIPNEKVRQARSLAQRRRSLTERSVTCKNAIRSLLREYHVKPCKALWGTKGIQWLRRNLVRLPQTIQLCVEVELETLEHTLQAIERVDVLMAKLVHEDTQAKLLMTIPGIGYHAAFIIMAEIGDVRRFASAKKVVSYAGICPRVSQTGKSGARLGNITKNGRALLRWIVVECAHSACKGSPKLRRLYWRVKKRGNASKAKVAAGRKLLTLCYHVLKSGTIYSEAKESNYGPKLRKLAKRAN